LRGVFAVDRRGVGDHCCIRGLLFRIPLIQCTFGILSPSPEALTPNGFFLILTLNLGLIPLVQGEDKKEAISSP
jgi:hypothetical protein